MIRNKNIDPNHFSAGWAIITAPLYSGNDQQSVRMPYDGIVISVHHIRTSPGGPPVKVGLLRNGEPMAEPVEIPEQQDAVVEVPTARGVPFKEGDIVKASPGGGPAADAKADPKAGPGDAIVLGSTTLVVRPKLGAEK